MKCFLSSFFSSEVSFFSSNKEIILFENFSPQKKLALVKSKKVQKKTVIQRSTTDSTMHHAPKTRGTRRPDDCDADECGPLAPMIASSCLRVDPNLGYRTRLQVADRRPLSILVELMEIHK